MRELVGLFIILMLFFLLMCDKYNIVEPRYYNKKDLAEFPVGNPDSRNNNSGDDGENDMEARHTPTDTELTPFWNSASKDTLFIQFTNPKPSYVKLLILNWNGSVFETLIDGNIEVGMYRYYYNTEKFEKQIYGISLRLDNWHNVLWFEMK